MENKFKENRLGGCGKLDYSILFKDGSGNLLSFTGSSSVMFVCCKKCGSLFEADRSLADNLIFVAKSIAELNNNEFPQGLLSEKHNYQDYYLEMDNCDNCDPSAEETKFFAKKIPEKSANLN